MMSNGGVKFYKNPHRSDGEDNKKYTPQYQLMGVVPEQGDGMSFVPSMVKIANPSLADNPRTRQPSIRLDEESDTEPNEYGSGNGLVNIGNHQEQAWVGEGDHIYDDISDLDIDPNHPMIDNNDYVMQEDPLPEKQFFSKNDFLEALGKDVLDSLSSLKNDDYVIMYDNTLVGVGSHSDIESILNSLIFGEHPVCNNKPISPDRISVFKKIPIKVGAFVG